MSYSIFNQHDTHTLKVTVRTTGRDPKFYEIPAKERRVIEEPLVWANTDYQLSYNDVENSPLATVFIELTPSPKLRYNHEQRPGNQDVGYEGDNPTMRITDLSSPNCPHVIVGEIPIFEDPEA